eukprot:6195931-Pleurochrysis_carterae.AAC.1
MRESASQLLPPDGRQGKGKGVRVLRRRARRTTVFVRKRHLKTSEAGEACEIGSGTGSAEEIQMRRGVQGKVKVESEAEERGKDDQETTVGQADDAEAYGQHKTVQAIQFTFKKKHNGETVMNSNQSAHHGNEEVIRKKRERRTRMSMNTLSHAQRRRRGLAQRCKNANRAARMRARAPRGGRSAWASSRTQRTALVAASACRSAARDETQTTT